MQRAAFLASGHSRTRSEAGGSRAAPMYVWYELGVSLRGGGPLSSRPAQWLKQQQLLLVPYLSVLHVRQNGPIMAMAPVAACGPFIVSLFPGSCLWDPSIHHCISRWEEETCSVLKLAEPLDLPPSLRRGEGLGSSPYHVVRPRQWGCFPLLRRRGTSECVILEAVEMFLLGRSW